MSRIHFLGQKGENLAADYLNEQGYQIIHRNYRYLKAEIDIIARTEGVLVMVEVKSRHEGFYEDISEAIPIKKRNLMVLAADHYVQKHRLDVEVRFDIITVIKTSFGFALNHEPDAFYHF